MALRSITKPVDAHRIEGQHHLTAGGFQDDRRRVRNLFKLATGILIENTLLGLDRHISLISGGLALLTCPVALIGGIHHLIHRRKDSGGLVILRKRGLVLIAGRLALRVIPSLGRSGSLGVSAEALNTLLGALWGDPPRFLRVVTPYTPAGVSSLRGALWGTLLSSLRSAT